MNKFAGGEVDGERITIIRLGGVAGATYTNFFEESFI